MGPNYDNQRYPQVKPFTIKDFMKNTSVENLGGAYFAWESKTLKN